MSRPFRIVGLLTSLCLGLTVGSLAPAMAAGNAPPRLGILMPVAPADRSIIMGAMRSVKTERFGAFTYQTGTIAGVPVVVNVAPGKGPLVRSLAAQVMLQHYRLGALLYPGTSGAHLPAPEMRTGDIVLGAANVDFGSFFMDNAGGIRPHEGADAPTDKRSFETFYLDPRLLARLACAAYRTASSTTLPAWVNPQFPRKNPEVFYYGLQGTSGMWLANTDFIGKLAQTFGEIDEDGDWDSNMVAVLYKVPFIEVSAISDSIFEFPETKLGVPAIPPGAGKGTSQIAQDLSNHVLLDLIEHDGLAILKGTFTTDATKPFPNENFATPKSAGALLREGKCQ